VESARRQLVSGAQLPGGQSSLTALFCMGVLFQKCSLECFGRGKDRMSIPSRLSIGRNEVHPELE